MKKLSICKTIVLYNLQTFFKLTILGNIPGYISAAGSFNMVKNFEINFNIPIPLFFSLSLCLQVPSSDEKDHK